MHVTLLGFSREQKAHLYAPFTSIGEMLTINSYQRPPPISAGTSGCVPSGMFRKVLHGLSILAVGTCPVLARLVLWEEGDLPLLPRTWPPALSIGGLPFSFLHRSAWGDLVPCTLPTTLSIFLHRPLGCVDTDRHCPLGRGDAVLEGLAEASWLFPGEARASVLTTLASSKGRGSHLIERDSAFSLWLL